MRLIRPTARRRGAALLIVLVLLATLSTYAMGNGRALYYLRHALNDTEARQLRTLDRIAKTRYGAKARVVAPERPRAARTKARPPSPSRREKRP